MSGKASNIFSSVAMHWGGTNKLSDCTLNLVSWCTGARIGPPGLVQVACTSGGKAAYLVLIRSTKRCADWCMVHMFLYLVHMRSAHTWCTHLVRILGAHTWCMFLVHEAAFLVQAVFCSRLTRGCCLLHQPNNAGSYEHCLYEHGISKVGTMHVRYWDEIVLENF